MSFRFGLWAILLVISLSVTGLSIRLLADRHVPLSQSLLARGLVCLILVWGWAKRQQLSLIPKSIKTQVFRALIAGLALTFFSMSYNWLSASTVAVLSNIDVPMLVILGSFVGQNSTLRAKLLSLISIVILAIYTLSLQRQPQWLLGISVLGIGTVLLCFGYFFIKKSMTEENEVITVLTPSLAIIAYGLVQWGLEPMTTSVWNSLSVISVIISGIGMFGAYYATMRLYELTDITTAEFPTLLSSVAIQPMEAIFFRESLSVSHLWLSIVFVFVTYLILRTENKEAVV
tara:strand:+ start:22062 stop:22925 length:864 start_codon:yes stop_codon:yes gene_type:complete